MRTATSSKTHHIRSPSYEREENLGILEHVEVHFVNEHDVCAANFQVLQARVKLHLVGGADDAPVLGKILCFSITELLRRSHYMNGSALKFEVR